jgi:hypothetical protein
MNVVLFYEYCVYCGKKLELTDEVNYCRECMRKGYHLPQELTNSTSSTMEDTKRFQEQAYQRRLDNVLSKMKQLGKLYYRYEKEYKGTYFFVADYDVKEKQFYMMRTTADKCQNFENGYLPIDIDLAEKLIETVESLLADLSNE